MDEVEEIIENKPVDQDTSVNNVKKPKKKHRLIKRLAIIVAVIAVIVLVLGLVLPGLLWPKDLGVRYSKQDYDSFLKKANYVKDLAPTGNSEDIYNYVYGPTTPVSTKFTSAELTAFANYNRPSYYAAKNIQIRVNSDGTVEASGTVNVDYVLNEVLGGKYSRTQIVKEIPALGLLPGSVNLYLSLTGSIINNSANLGLNSVTVQGIPIPNTYVKSSEGISTATTGVNNLISKSNVKSGANIEKLATENENIVLQGQFPTSLTRIKK